MALRGFSVRYTRNDRFCSRCRIRYAEDEALPHDRVGGEICRVCHMKVRRKSKCLRYKGEVPRVDC